MNSCYTLPFSRMVEPIHKPSSMRHSCINPTTRFSNSLQND
eukprot:UN07682